MFQSGDNTGIEVPEDVVTTLGSGKRPAVVVNVNGFEYRSTVAVMGAKAADTRARRIAAIVTELGG